MLRTALVATRVGSLGVVGQKPEYLGEGGLRADAFEPIREQREKLGARLSSDAYVLASGESLEADGPPNSVPGQTFECFSVIFVEVSVRVEAESLEKGTTSAPVPWGVVRQRQVRLGRGGELECHQRRERDAAR